MPADSGQRRYAEALAAAVLVGLAAQATAQSDGGAPEVAVSSALEISLTPPGSGTFDLEFSDNLKDWLQTETRVFPGAGPVRITVEKPEGYGYFRWQEVRRPAGLAPRLLADTGLIFTRGGESLHYRFSEGFTGRVTDGDTSSEFRWQWLRTGANTGTATLDFGNGSTESLEVTYRARGIGTFTRTRTLPGIARSHREDGTFISGRRLTSAEVPSRIRRSALLVSDAAGSALMTFDSNRSGVCSASGPFRCETTRPNRTRRLIVTIALENGLDQEYDLTFTGSESGRFERRIYAAGVLRDEDTGTFSYSSDYDDD